MTNFLPLVHSETHRTKLIAHLLSVIVLLSLLKGINLPQLLRAQLFGLKFQVNLIFHKLLRAKLVIFMLQSAIIVHHIYL